MKQRKHRALKITRITLILSVLLLFNSCTEQNRVQVALSESASFPIIEVANPNSPEVIFAPVSETTGSIGLEVEGSIIWLSGMPVRTESEDAFSTLAWEISEGETVEMQINDNTEELNFLLRLVSGDKQLIPTKWFINTRAAKEEYFTGVFERMVDGPQGNSWKEGIETAMDLRNERVEMKVKSTLSAYAPFYLSSSNYGFYVEGTWPGVFDFCKAQEDFVQIAFEGPEMQFKLFLGPTPLQIVKRHALETGPSFVPPRWAFGPWRWRDDHTNRTSYFDGSNVSAPFNSELVEDILMMEAYDIPCTAYWIDRPWGPGAFGFDNYDVDSIRLPNFEKMISWLNDKDIELMLWICPWVVSDMATVAKEKGYNLLGREMRGIPPNVTDEKMRARIMEMMSRRQETLVMDFTNPEACAWWAENGPGKLAKMGVKGFKLDRGDGERLVDSLNLYTSSGTTYRENYNDYGRQFVKATYDAVEPVLGDDFVLFPRVQYTGSARYGAMWAGDTDNSAEGLRSALIALQRCSVMGYPIHGSDAGGYPQKLDRAVTVRWLGFACFSPIMEIGPTNNRGFWGLNDEPSYDTDLMAAWRFYSKLRMSLVDYIHSLAKQAGETGMPVARPLFLEYPEQEESWKDWRTYKLGDDLLISVVWETGKTSQKVYLPAGETWINQWDGQEYDGGQYLEVEAPLHQTPVFLRKGSGLVLPDFNELYAESVEITLVRHKMEDLEAGEGWR